jgi:hypothetical protein
MSFVLILDACALARVRVPDWPESSKRPRLDRHTWYQRARDEVDRSLLLLG